MVIYSKYGKSRYIDIAGFSARSHKSSIWGVRTYAILDLGGRTERYEPLHNVTRDNMNTYFKNTVSRNVVEWLVPFASTTKIQNGVCPHSPYRAIRKLKRAPMSPIKRKNKKEKKILEWGSSGGLSVRML